MLIADVPQTSGRLGRNFSGRDYVTEVLSGKPTISKPFFGTSLNTPVVVMLVPVVDASDKVLGALAGVTDLGIPNFLDKVTEADTEKPAIICSFQANTGSLLWPQ